MLPLSITYEHPQYDIEGTWNALEETARLVFPFDHPSDPVDHVCEHKVQLIRQKLKPVAALDTIDIIPAEDPPIAKVEALLSQPSVKDIGYIIQSHLPLKNIEDQDQVESVVAESMKIIVGEQLEFCANAIVRAIPLHVPSREFETSQD